MTLTRAERDALFADFDAIARGHGGQADRSLFDTACDFAAVGDRDAQRTLLKIFRLVNQTLLRGQNRTGR